MPKARMGKLPPALRSWFVLAGIVVVTSLPILVVSVSLYNLSQEAERRMIDVDTEIMANTLGQRVQSYFRNRVVALKMGAVFYESSTDVDTGEFAKYAGELQKDFPEFLFILYLDGEGTVRQSFPATYRNWVNRPLEDRSLRAMAQRAFAEGKQKVSLLPSLERGEGVVILQPVVKNNVRVGILVGGLSMPKAMDNFINSEIIKFWNFQIEDERGIAHPDVLPENVLTSASPASVPFQFGDKEWRLVLRPKTALRGMLRTSNSELSLLCGGLTTVLVICGVATLYWRQRRLRRALDETQQAHTVVQASERRFREVMERVHLLVVVVDRDTKVTFCNDRFVQISGYEREELIGQDAIELLVQPETRKVFRKLKDDVLNLRSQEIPKQIPLMTKAGKVRLAEWNHVISYDEHGEVAGVTMLGEDITDRVAFEEAQRQSQKLESLGVLAGGIAHDFNNLLTTIIGHNDLAIKKISADQVVKPHLENVGRTARRLADLTSQMLAYSGRGRFEVREVNINELVTEMADLLRISIPKRVEIRYDLHPRLPLIKADATQIEQVLLNVVTNAAEAIQNRPGWISLRTTLRQLTPEDVEAPWSGQKLRPGTYIELIVEDNGCGMNAETQQRIFDPFFTTKFTGRGLGLAVLQGIMRGHDGAVTVDSQLGVGTTFHVLFPSVPGGELRRMMPSANRLVFDFKRDQTAHSQTGEGTVLIVDDEESVRQLAADIVATAGFKVLTACNGEAGVELYRKHEAEISAVVLDLTMPGIGGEEAYNQMRAIDPEARILLTSGYSNSEIETRFQDKKLAGFVQKPFLPAELLEKIFAVARSFPDGRKART